MAKDKKEKMINTCTIQGTIRKHWGLKAGVGKEGNTSVCSFVLQQGKSQFACVGFDEKAHEVSQFDEGDSVIVNGRLNQNKWEDDSGVWKEKFQIIVERMESVGGKKRDEEPPADECVYPESEGDDIPF